jgi:lysophospholipase L1-like esterase
MRAALPARGLDVIVSWMRTLLDTRLPWLALGLAGLVLMLWVACVFPFGRHAPKAASAPGADASAPRADAGAGPAPASAAPVPPSFPPYAGHPDDVTPVPVPIEGVDRLEYYYSKLTLTELGYPGAITRASHWGDSVIGGDGMTEMIRRRLQQRFGDAGHGFHTVGRYSRWYRHRGVRYEERRDWDTCLIIFKCEPDQRYGYGGVTSSSRGTGRSHWQTVLPQPALPPSVTTRAKTEPSLLDASKLIPTELEAVKTQPSAVDELGQRVSRFELWYQKRPDGGGFEIRVDGQVQRIIDSRAAEVGDGFETVELEDGAHAFEVNALGRGVAQAYGVVLERDGPGVVWDELSLIGSFTQRLDYQDAEHLAGQVRRRDVDLMVFILGGNDLMREKTDLKENTDRYEAEYARVIRKFRAGKPQASCMIMALTDHAQRVDGVIRSRPIVGRLAAAQRKVASAEGCAFFDTFEATGGLGTIERWRQAKPPLASPDLRHPTLAGQRHIATLLYAALMKGYADYRQQKVGQPLPQASPPSELPPSQLPASERLRVVPIPPAPASQGAG